MIPCRECRKPVGRGADACPFCGATSPWSRKNPRRGNDALWVMGTLIIGTIVLLALGCNSTSPDGDHVPQVGRYDYQLDHQGVHLSADLVVLDASATQVRYRFFTEGQAGQNIAVTVQYTNGSWIANAFLSGRSAANTVTREGNTYRCTAMVLLLNTSTPGTCSVTFEGPDSVRTAPQ